MAEATPTKRVLPARERAESSAKRRVSSPAEPATPASEPRQKRKYTKRASLVKTPTPATGTPDPFIPTEEALPTRLYASKPLPTGPQKQPDKIPNSEYQSIAQSAVLAASLHRSRMQWLCNGIFKRYWTKPTKRKGVIEQPPGNPDAKSMSKLGNATMTIEPHQFDVTFYTVKDASMVPPPYSRHPSQPLVKPVNPSYSAHAMAQPSLTPPTPVQTGAAQEHVSPPPLPSGPVTAPIAKGNNHLLKQETSIAQIKPENTSSAASSSSVPQLPIAHAPTQSVAPAPSGVGKPATDPVIQMLAARAATDTRLKELMKIVATSQASVEQLREFQAHIDELNKIVKQQEAKKAEDEKKKKPLPPVTATGTAQHSATHGALTQPQATNPTAISRPSHITPPTFNSHPQSRAEPFIKHVLVEFHTAASAAQGPSTDRWLFPEHAILDIKSGGMEMVASFLVMQKGEEVLKRQGNDDDGEAASRFKFRAEVEYYQPVTVLIKATQHRTIETIARAAKPLVECQNYMKEVMETRTRAPLEYLVHRLPRERALTESHAHDFVDSAVEMSNDEDDELRDLYGV